MTGDKHLDALLSTTAGSSESAAPTVAARWRAIARSRGDAAAIRTPEQSITFAQAATRVDDLARAILDTTPTDSPVAVEIESDIDSVISMLAVWCAGRSLVMVDPFLPDDAARTSWNCPGHISSPRRLSSITNFTRRVSSNPPPMTPRSCCSPPGPPAPPRAWCSRSEHPSTTRVTAVGSWSSAPTTARPCCCR